jgi:hypothetical protein
MKIDFRNLLGHLSIGISYKNNMEFNNVTNEKDEQKQNTYTPKPSSAQGCELFSLREVWSRKAASRSV